MFLFFVCPAISVYCDPPQLRLKKKKLLCNFEFIGYHQQFEILTGTAFVFCMSISSLFQKFPQYAPCVFFFFFLTSVKEKKKNNSSKKDNQYEWLQMTFLYLPLMQVELPLTGLSYSVGRQALYIADSLQRYRSSKFICLNMWKIYRKKKQMCAHKSINSYKRL